MEINRLAALRPRFVWDIVDDAFDLYRERFALFCGISACVELPVALLTIVYTAVGVTNLRGPGSADPMAAFGFLAPFLFFTVPLSGAALVLQYGATAAAVEASLAGHPITIGQAYRRVLTRFWPLLGAMFLTGLCVFVGTCAAGIGALFAAAALAFIGQAVVLENRGAWDATRRSVQLALSNPLKVLGMVLLIGVLTSCLTASLQWSLEALLALVPSRGQSSAQAVQRLVLTQSISSVVSLFLQPLSALATTLLYYDLRVRREGLDIATAAEEAGVALAPDPFGDVSSEAAYHRMNRTSGTGR